MYGWLLFKLVLFVAYVPGVVFRMLPNSSPLVQAFAHGVLFAVVMHLAHMVSANVRSSSSNPSTRSEAACPAGSHKCPSGDCVLDGDKHSPCH